MKGNLSCKLARPKRWETPSSLCARPPHDASASATRHRRRAARSTMDEQRALLDQLMGSQRDVPDELKREVHFYDREIDKFWLLGVQPFDLFKNTIWAPKLPVFHRMALGYEWEKREQPLSVLAEWDALDAGARAAYGYERDLYKFLEVLVEACDRAVKRARDAHYARATEVTGADAKRAVDMDRRIAELEKEAEACGEAGDVDGSLARMAEIDAVNAQKAELVKPPDAALKKVLVCVEIKYSTRLQCARNRTIRTSLFSRASRAIDSSKNQLNRLRFDRAREFQSLVGTSQTSG